MKFLSMVFLFAVPNLSMGASFECLILSQDRKKEFWSGTLTLKEKDKIAADVRIIESGGKDKSLSAILGKAGSSAQERLKPYDGLMAIGLKREAKKLFLNSAHVDSSKLDNSVPFDAMAWTSNDAKEFGLIDYKKNLEISCSRKIVR